MFFGHKFKALCPIYDLISHFWSQNRKLLGNDIDPSMEPHLKSLSEKVMFLPRSSISDLNRK